MEPKKNPEKDIHRKSGMYFMAGLGISVSLVICAFEWETIKKEFPPPQPDSWENDIIVIDPPVIDLRSPEPPKTKPEPIKIAAITPVEIVEGTDGTPSEDVPSIDVGGSTPIFGPPDSEPVPDPDFVLIAEQQPVPKGGMEKFHETISRNLKYPLRAVRANVEGKVFVEFIVGKDGRPTDLRVIKGIGYGCDEEAIKVLAMTEWEPGRQRGKPVRVKMALPLQFRLD